MMMIQVALGILFTVAIILALVLINAAIVYIFLTHDLNGSWPWSKGK